MNSRVLLLARQLLQSVPKDDMATLIKLLEYYNRFAEHQRVQAIDNGSTPASDPLLEGAVQEELQRMKYSKQASQASYVTSGSQVCRCCGK